MIPEIILTLKKWKGEKKQLFLFTHSVLSDSFLPMDCSTPGLPVHHQHPELAQTHVHWVSDTMQPFHPLSSPSPPAFSLSQHQDFFQWASFLHQVAKVLEFSFSISPFNGYSGLISSRVHWFKIKTSCWTTINRRMLDPIKKKDTPCPRAKEKPLQDGHYWA